MKCDRRRSQAKSPAIWKSDGSVNAAYVRYLINARGRDQRGVGVPLFALNCSHVLAYFSESSERERVRDASWREQLHRRRAPNADEVPRSLSLSFSRKRTLPRLFLFSPFSPSFLSGDSPLSPFWVYAALSTCARYFSAHSMLVLRPVWFTIFFLSQYPHFSIPACVC